MKFKKIMPTLLIIVIIFSSIGLYFSLNPGPDFRFQQDITSNISIKVSYPNGTIYNHPAEYHELINVSKEDFVLNLTKNFNIKSTPFRVGLLKKNCNCSECINENDFIFNEGCDEALEHWRNPDELECKTYYCEFENKYYVEVIR